LRSLLAAACVAAGLLGVPAASAAGPVAVRANPCSIAYDAPSGDAPLYYAVPNDPDLDVTHVSWTFGVTDVVVVAKVATLADGPLAAWGDEFDAVVYDRTTKQQVSFGYFRSRSGGGPTFGGGRVPYAKSPAGAGWSAYPGGATHLVADFDTKASTVTLTIPRADLEWAFGVPSSRLLLTGLGVNSYAMDPSYSATMADFGHAALDPQTAFFTVSDCDRWLAKRGVRAAPVATACGVDIVAETGDETSRTSDVTPTRDDDLDLARVTYRITATDLVVTIRVARLTDRPVVGTGQGYSARFLSHGDLVEFGVTRDAVDGVRMRQFAGKAVTPMTVKASFDAGTHRVVLTIPRAALATAYGLQDTRSLVIADMGATAFFTLNGQSASTADGDANATGRTLSFRACDKASHRR
jgi:hypothetical protein